MSAGALSLRKATAKNYGYTPVFAQATPDPYWSNVALLLHGDGTANTNSNVLLDSSANGIGITRTGSPAQGSVSPFQTTQGNSYNPALSGGSMYFDGASSAVTAANAGFSTAGDFTLECFIYTAALGTSVAFLSLTSTATSPNSYIGFYVYNATGQLRAECFDNASQQWALNSSAGAITTNVWTHIALVRSSGTTKIYAAGVSVGSVASNAYSPLWFMTVGALTFGGNPSNFFTGHVSNVRFTASALYTGNFAAPVAPLAPVADTQLLLSGTNATIYDSARKANIACIGNPLNMVSVNKFGGSSIYFDGNSTVRAPTPSPVGTSFTVEFWMFPLEVPAVGFYLFDFSALTEDWTATGHILEVTLLPSMVMRSAWKTTGGGPTTFNTTVTMAINNWYHFALTYDGTTFCTYTNGVASGSGTNAFVTANGGWLNVGMGGGGVLSSAFKGYVDDFRYTKGVARYTSNFTPPASAFIDTF